MRIDALEHLRDELAAARLVLDLPDAEGARSVRSELVAQIDDYLLPRLRQRDAPLLMVVGGSTGAGKSTLVNSLVGAEVSAPGVLRPTTRAPVLACNPADVSWFESDRILPGLARGSGGAGARGLELVPTSALPAGLALLDSPDVDSVADENRALAAQLLAAADSWLFVTTAARYADAVPWELLHAASQRGTALAVVLNRVPADAGEVAAHLTQMLADRGLGGTELLVVPETELAAGLLPPAALAPVRTWLDELAADAQARTALIERTLAGALASIPPRVETVRRAVVAQAAAAGELSADADAAYDRALTEVEDTLASGKLLRGEVLARWYEVVGTGDVMRAIEARVSWARDRLWSLVMGRPSADSAVKEAVETGIESVVRAAAARAADRAARTWRERPAGQQLLAASPRLDDVSPGLHDRLEDEVRAWQGDVFELVRREGMTKRTTARLASLGVNGAGLTVMLAVFVQTGGLTGAEIAVAGGTTAVGQKVLEAIFGDQAVRELAAKARENLVERVASVLETEAARFHELVGPVAPATGADERLAAAVAALRR
jgi:energy-coupling factor transporter ATP-binding protein EcfA2